MPPKTYTCQRCSHTWQTRIDHLPVRCPKCQSTRWDKPRNGSTVPTVKEELLEACKAVRDLEYVSDHTPAYLTRPVYEMILAAIARAEREG